MKKKVMDDCIKKVIDGCISFQLAQIHGTAPVCPKSY